MTNTEDTLGWSENDVSPNQTWEMLQKLSSTDTDRETWSDAGGVYRWFFDDEMGRRNLNKAVDLFSQKVADGAPYCLKLLPYDNEKTLKPDSILMVIEPTAGQVKLGELRQFTRDIADKVFGE